MAQPAQTFHRDSVLWGQAFEVLVKRGVLGALADAKIIDLARPGLEAWTTTRVADVAAALIRELDVADETVREQMRCAVSYLATTGYGLGVTVTREYLRRLGTPLRAKRLAVKALWCPLALPGDRSDDHDEQRLRTAQSFHLQFGLSGRPDIGLCDKGMPANADFALWLGGEHKEEHLLVQEYSFDMPAAMGDFRDQDAHLNALLRHRRLIDSRGVFARVSAEVQEEQFELSEGIRRHLAALTSENKPLYKLCQASAYAESTARLLALRTALAKPCMVRALAITPNGVESLAARFCGQHTRDSRYTLMGQLGQAYRQAVRLPDGDRAGLARAAESVFEGVLRRLPSPLYRKLKALHETPKAGIDWHFDLSEEVTDFANPMHRLARKAAIDMVPEDPALSGYFGCDSRQAVAHALDALCGDSPEVPLRDLHAAAIVAGLRAARKGRVNVLALEGNPGIGKTTAITRHLAGQADGYLFLYLSPRVIINRDVNLAFARGGDSTNPPSGVLTVTSNSQLIASAERWYRELAQRGEAPARHVEGAVVADGVVGLRRPRQSSILVLDASQEQRVTDATPGSRISKTAVSEHEDRVRDRHLMGVIGTMAQATRELLVENPALNRVALTAALQGFREKAGGGSTIESLSRLFSAPAHRPDGLRERMALARRVPTIVVMVDELAGDGAGAPFVHAIARWLEQEFIDPFRNEPQFTVVLVVSDASLGNEVVLDRYLNAGEHSPDKILVSASAGKQAFRLAATDVVIGGPRRSTLHVMTNSFPASELRVRYRIKLSSIAAPTDLSPKAVRKAIREQAGGRLLESAVQEIRQALAVGSRQAIYFAQDKQLLTTIKAALLEDETLGLAPHEVQNIDSSVAGWERAARMAEKARDATRVFLMTSSAARGVSFPRADYIIAAVPRFAIEQSLMEIAQLIYRGRGFYTDESGSKVSGDLRPRTLVMVVDDYVLHGEEADLRQWLRQSMDLMTLVVMLRGTILTRITGDAGLRHSLALVPVGSTGTEEVISLMAQHVTGFVREVEIARNRTRDRELAALLSQAQANVIELFSRFRLDAVTRRNARSASLVREDHARAFFQRAGTLISALLPPDPVRPEVGDHCYFAGPFVLESWADLEKREIFSFDGCEAQIDRLTRQLFMQLGEIEKQWTLPDAVRVPASNLRELLGREKPDAATEFSTVKLLKSPNTWVALPAAWAQFVTAEREHDGRARGIEDAELWLDALGGCVSAQGGVMPAIAAYERFPWAAGVGKHAPLGLDQVFDDRYFMASSELNLLNTLLLNEQQTP